MKTYTFRISQDLLAYYNAKVDIDAKNQEQAWDKINDMSDKQLDNIAYDWEQMTDNASPVGEITVQEVIDISDENIPVENKE